MKSKLVGLMALLSLLGLSPAYATTYTYSVAFPASTFTSGGTTTVTGIITTDCDNGCLLQPSDFVSWSFTFAGLLNATFSGGPSGAILSGPPNLEADPGDIKFLSSSTGETQLFSSVDIVEWSPNTISIFTNCCNQQTPSGDLIFATAATPLPAALPLFGTGLGLVGLLARRRKQKVAVVLPA